MEPHRKKKRVHPLVGSEERRLSYGLAWNKMLLAVENGFFVEAISLQENIIKDKLTAYLNLSHKRLLKVDATFKQVLDTWKRRYPDPISIKKENDLYESVDKWRQSRNGIIHGTLEMSVDVYSALEQETALKGKALASAVSDWCIKMVRRQRRELHEKPAQ